MKVQPSRLLEMQKGLSSLGTKVQEIVWTKRAQSWEDTPNPGLDKVVQRVVDLANESPYEQIIDLGCGSGQLALPLAIHAKKVIAVDIAPTMLQILENKAAKEGVTNIETLCSSLEALEITPSTLDLAVSNYVLHHLSDQQKQEALKKAHTWIKPGGRVIIGDMMFGRGTTSEDRKIIYSKVQKLAKLGPGGWWRIAKNVVRFTLRVQEKPVSVETWRKYLTEAGFVSIVFENVVGEGYVVTAKKQLDS